MRLILISAIVASLCSCNKVEESKDSEPIKKASLVKKETTKKVAPVKKEEKSSSLSLGAFSLTSTTTKEEKKEPTQSRPAFLVKNKGIKPQDCNLPFTDDGDVFIPENMKIHDYFKFNNEYHFAVSVDSKSFLLNAKSIVKDKADKDALTLAFKFAKYCKAKALKASGAAPTSAKSSVANQVKSRDMKNLEVLIKQQEDAIQYHRDQIAKLNKTLSYKRSQLSKYPRYTVRGKVCTSVLGYHVHGTGRCYDNHKSSSSKYSRCKYEIAKLQKKVATENKYISKKNGDLSAYKSQLAKLK